MSYDSLAHTLSLGLGCAERLQFLECKEAALELKGHVCFIPVLGCRGKIMEETGQCPCLKERLWTLGDPGLEVK